MTSLPKKENVWDYPRPPALEAVDWLLEVKVAGQTLASTTRGHRVLETSHPPTYYLPMDDVDATKLVPLEGTTHCEWKGAADYFGIGLLDNPRRRAAWTYPDPSPRFRPIAGYLAFYCTPQVRCFVAGEEVQPQDGDFYGGWKTSWLTGKMKGGPGTWGW